MTFDHNHLYYLLKIHKGNILSLGDGELPSEDYDISGGSNLDDRLSVSILPTTLTVTHVSTMYIVNPTDDAANLHSQRIDRPLTNDAGQIGNSRKISEAQCGNFMIFLSLRIYVKSILRIPEVQNLPLLPF